MRENPPNQIYIPAWHPPKMWTSHYDYHIDWKEDEGWDAVKERYSVQLHDTFSDCMVFDEEDIRKESLDFCWPYSCTVYDFPEKFVITNGPVAFCEDLQHGCCVPKNYMCVLEFYKEMCIPFLVKQ